MAVHPQIPLTMPGLSVEDRGEGGGAVCVEVERRRDLNVDGTHIRVVEGKDRRRSELIDRRKGFIWLVCFVFSKNVITYSLLCAIVEKIDCVRNTHNAKIDMWHSTLVP